MTYQAGDLRRPDESRRWQFSLVTRSRAWCWGWASAKRGLVEVKWPQPSGAVERFTNLPVDRYITLVEGSGKWR